MTPRVSAIGLVVTWAAALLAVGVAGPHAVADDGYKPDYEEPAPGTPAAEVRAAERRYRDAEARYDRVVNAVQDADERAFLASRRLREANAAVDQYLAEQEALGPNPARREAVSAVEEAEREMRAARQRAIKPLDGDPVYQKWARRLAEMRERFAELEKQRLRADFIGRTMDERDRRDLVAYAQNIFELNAKVYGRELALLDEHAGYQEAVRKVAETKRVAKETVTWLRELEQADPQRRALIRRVMEATKESETADTALDAARRQRGDARTAVTQAAAALEQARQRKTYADKGLKTGK